jgi:hypothetical protein
MKRHDEVLGPRQKINPHLTGFFARRRR